MKENQTRFFVLRNNDLGDVLVSTPLLNGLRTSFPSSKICIGVGDWAKPLLDNNPDIDQIYSCNAPWHNKQICKFPANSKTTFLEGLLFILFSKEVRDIYRGRFTHGIDVLGSRQGSWLMLRSRILNRYGVNGYAGGSKWCSESVDFIEDRNVAQAGLAFLPLLGASKKVDSRPRIFHTKNEIKAASMIWGKKLSGWRRIIIAPGGGFPEKCWGDSKFSGLLKLLLKKNDLQVCIIGSKEDEFRVHYEFNSKKPRVLNLCGSLSLRESSAMVSQSDFVITNSSLCMHLAGAFKKRSITLLGDWYDSAKKHHIQWGYPEGIVLGKELIDGRKEIASISEAYEIILRQLEYD